VALVGFDGGKLKDISDVVIHVKAETGEYGPVDDVQYDYGPFVDYLVAV